MAGDSTMAIKADNKRPETGWGEPFASMFDGRLSIENRAQNGRSTRTFINEGRWGLIIEALNPDDVVIIEFGHNDEFESKKERYTTPAQFKANLFRMIEDVRSRGAEAILLSPIARRKFSDGHASKETHPYGDIVDEVATESGVFFVDLEALTIAWLEGLGEEKSRSMFLQLAPGLHPNYPSGVNDNTHLNNAGAKAVAEIVIQQLLARKHRLAEYIQPKQENT